MNRNCISLWLIALILLVSCGKKQEKAPVEEVALTAEAAQDSDIVFKQIGNDTLRLDIYRNRVMKDSIEPTIIYIHGGSWTEGDRKGIDMPHLMALLNAFIENHITVISIDYRLGKTDGYRFADELQDCRDAIRWVRRNAKELRVDPEKIGLWGMSAGGHLSLVCGYQPTDSTEVDFILNNYGPTNLDKLFMTNLPKIAVFGAKIFKPALYKQRKELLYIFPDSSCYTMSPVNMVTASSIPTLTLQGDEDQTVPIEQADELNEVLTKMGVDHEYVIYHGEDHTFPTMTPDELKDEVTRSLNFAKKHFK